MDLYQDADSGAICISDGDGFSSLFFHQVLELKLDLSFVKDLRLLDKFYGTDYSVYGLNSEYPVCSWCYKHKTEKHGSGERQCARPDRRSQLSE